MQGRDGEIMVLLDNLEYIGLQFMVRILYIYKFTGIVCFYRLCRFLYNDNFLVQDDYVFFLVSGKFF